ncbi:hypothetical protein PHYC_03779 [Phycisphaerales bacterium]|nr:hypothetical protein PHYC_03779 [Phycisphaerales bacterium]
MGEEIGRVVLVLERTPAVLRALLAGLGPELANANYGPGTWSAYEVLGHLIVGERLDWMPRAGIILAHGASRPFDPFPHDATIRPETGRSLDSLLDEFERLRRDNLRDLASLNLTPEQLELRGRHPALGEVTLGQLLSTWAAHDLHHIRQACLAMAWRFRDGVGPWREYLNTLTPRR